MTKRKAKLLLLIHRIFGCSLFWKFRNPYSKVCGVCKRRDDEFTMSEGEAHNWYGSSWWETVSYGKHGETKLIKRRHYEV